jgi:hypothetical protein
MIIDLSPIDNIKTDGCICKIAGMSYYPDTMKNLKIKQQLYLVLEKNKFGSHSIVIMTKKKQKCGYVPSLLTNMFKKAFEIREDGVFKCHVILYKSDQIFIKKLE